MSTGPALPEHLHRGVDAENSALAHLQANGLQLVERNYRCAAGELDMVRLDRQALVFVEVRYRRSERFGGAARSVDAGKQRKLRCAGEAFLQDRSGLVFNLCRFDVVAVTGTAPDYQIDWISDAF